MSDSPEQLSVENMLQRIDALEAKVAELMKKDSQQPAVNIPSMARK